MVEIVSGQSLFSREQVVMILVLQSPVKESFRIRVSLELRQGMCSAELVNADTTLPRHDRDRFIFLAYSKFIPWTPLLLTFSLPAKSMKHSLVLYSFPMQKKVRYTNRMVCERDEESLVKVLAILRSRYPNLMSFMIYQNCQTLTSTIPQSSTESSSSLSLIYGDCFAGSKRSLSFQLYIQRIEQVMMSSCCFRSKMYYKVLGMRPYVSLSFRLPNIVNVFPDPVCPYVNIVEFCPLKKLSTCLPPIEQNTSDCFEYLSKIWSQLYLFQPSSIMFSSKRTLDWFTDGLNRQYTLMLLPSVCLQCCSEVQIQSFQLLVARRDSGKLIVIFWSCNSAKGQRYYRWGEVIGEAAKEGKSPFVLSIITSNYKLTTIYNKLIQMISCLIDKLQRIQLLSTSKRNL